jgi:hypothetical protein
VFAGCDAGWGSCDGDLGDGCETDLTTDPGNCGACLGECALPNATAGCIAGGCTVAACQDGWEDRDGIAESGCEADVSGPVTVELGPEETVMAWSDGQRCTPTDIPDQPARAFVDSSGRVHLLDGSDTSWAWVGDNLKALAHDCSAPVATSDHDPDPRAYDDWEIVNSVYTLDGQTIYGLVHDEYEGWTHGTCPWGSSWNMACWWNAVTLIASRDAGASFRHAPPLIPPLHVVASSPYDYDPEAWPGAFGFFDPSNILGWGGQFYAFMHMEQRGTQERGACLMRTDDLAAPASWRGWDGTGFTAVLDRGICPPLQPEHVGTFNSSLTYNSYFHGFLLASPEGLGFQMITSQSLTSWPASQLLLATDLWWTGGDEVRHYPSFLQPGDPSLSFDRTGRSPYLYYTLWHRSLCDYCRDLVRRRVRLTKPGDEGRFQVLELPMNERRGAVTLDASFYGNDAAMENGAVLDATAPATGAAAVRLPAAEPAAQLRVRAVPSLDLSGSITIEAFVRTAQPAQSEAVIVENQAGTLRNYGLYVEPPGAPSPGVLAFSFSAPGGGLSSSTGTRRVDDGGWHHVAVVYDGSATTARYYVDGELDVERPHGTTLEHGMGGGDLLVGTHLVGWVDAVVVHDHARTAQEIREAALAPVDDQ